MKKRAFLNALMKEGCDLKKIVCEIKKQKRTMKETENSIKQFLKDPYELLDDGRLRFYMTQERDGAFNFTKELYEEDNELLSVKPDRLERLLEEEGEKVMVYDRLRDKIFSPQERPEYSGPRIRLFPDSNILIDRETRKKVKALANGEEIVYDAPSFIKFESRRGGLKKRFRKNIPRTIWRGQKYLEKRCDALSADTREQMDIFYTILNHYFNREMKEIYRYSSKYSNMRPEEVASRFVEDRGKEDEDYYNIVRKQVKKLREKNCMNYIADRVLTALCFGFNIINDNDRSIVVSNDSDLKYMFRTLHEEVLPRYMFFSSLYTIKDKAGSLIPELMLDSETLFDTAKNNIDFYPKEQEERTAGILYSPRERKFYTYKIQDFFADFFKNPSIYRTGETGFSITYITNTRRGSLYRIAQLMLLPDEEFLGQSYPVIVMKSMHEVYS